MVTIRCIVGYALLAILARSNLCAQAILPQLTAVSRTSTSPVSPGGSVTFSYALTAGTSVVTYLGIRFCDSAGADRYASTSNPGASGTVTAPVEADWLNGAYTVKYVVLGDSAGRYIYYNPDGSITVSSGTGSGPTTHSLDLAALDFEVTGGVAQVVLPQLTAVSRTSVSPISPGGSVTFSYLLTAGTSPVTWMAVYFTDSNGTQRYVDAGSPGTSGSVSSTVATDWLNGAYTIQYVVLGDSAGRFIYYQPDGSITVSGGTGAGPTTHSLNLAALGFEVSGGVGQVTLPQLTVVSRTSVSPISPGGSVTFSYALTPGTSAVTWIAVYFSGPDGTARFASVLNPGSSGSVSSTVGTDWLNGAYTVQYVVMQDSGGRFIYYRADGSITVSGGTGSGPTTHSLSLATLGFQVSGGVVVSKAPVFVTQPTDITVRSGGCFSVTVSVTTTDFLPVTWKAKLGGRTINAASSASAQQNNSITASLSFGPVVLSDAGQFQILASNAYGTTESNSKTLSVTAAVTLDFDGDGKVDLLWRNSATGEYCIWLMNGTSFSSGVWVGTIPTPWQMIAAVDFNGDGQADILWRNTVTGECCIWLMNGGNFSSGVWLGVIPLEWQIAAVTDFDGDGHPDILWRNTSTGECSIWLMAGPNFSSGAWLGVVPTQWQIAAVTDFNDDGKVDLLWHNTATDEYCIWLMNGTSFSAGVWVGTIPTPWQMAATVDFNGDGQADILWRNAATGDLCIWLMNGGTYSSGVWLGNVPTQWQTVAVTDFDGDGHPDILWRNTSTGECSIWLMNGASFGSGVSLGIVSTQWQIKN